MVELILGPIVGASIWCVERFGRFSFWAANKALDFAIPFENLFLRIRDRAASLVEKYGNA